MQTCIPKYYGFLLFDIVPATYDREKTQWLDTYEPGTSSVVRGVRKKLPHPKTMGVERTEREAGAMSPALRNSSWQTQRLPCLDLRSRSPHRIITPHSLRNTGLRGSEKNWNRVVGKKGQGESSMAPSRQHQPRVHDHDELTATKFAIHKVVLIFSS
ncbi:hypothetical protein TNCV_1776891 [Trichonephila clavipes]|nr:hypothetical protein TNCV_1776891 [Trichonephila clavipes]